MAISGNLAKLAALIALSYSGALQAGPDTPMASHEDLKTRLLEGSRSLSQQTLGGLSKAKNAGTAWIHWTKYAQSGNKDALSALVKLAKDGSPDAMNIIGHIQAEGVMRPINIQDGVRWFSMAAAKGHGLAHYNLGLLYLQGRGVPKDEQKALELFGRALETEKIEQAMVRLMLNAYKYGRKAEAWEFANRAAEQKNRIGIYLIGRMLYEGSAPQKDSGAAMRWLHQAAEMYSPEAASLLARIYATDSTISNNEVMSAAWEMIATGMRRQGAGAIAQTASRLSSEDSEKAHRFATDWLRSHLQPAPTEYNKTLPLVGAKGG